MIDERERQKRRREFYIILLVAFFIVGITFLEVHLRGAESPAGSNIFFFTILNVNLILLLLLIFLVIRNLVKLMLERRRGLLGSRLRTKLVMAFILLSLVPAMLLFFISALFITRSVESWFSAQVERSLQGALEVAQLYYRDLAADTVHWSRRMATSPPSTLKGWERRRAEYGLSWMGLFDAKGKLLQRVSSKDLPEGLRPPKELVEEILKGKEATKVTPFRSGEMVWGGYGKGGRAVVAGHYVPEGVLSKMRDISKAFVDYKRSQILRRPITLNYLLLLLTITLLIIFSAIWFGLRLAKEITVPVGRLVEGTRRVAEGDLDFKLQVTSSDEIGALVEAFNRMTQDLKRSQEALQERRRYIEVVLENVSAGVISFDKRGRITTINQAAEEMLEVKASEVLGRYYREAMKPAFRKIARELIREMNASGSRRVERQTELSIDGKVVTVRVSLNAMRDERGEYLGMVAVFDDLTHLVKMQRLAAWREVARRIAHEIKNPLTPIQLSAERIYRRYKDRILGDKKVFEECTSTIIQQVKELKGLVNEFSQFARMPSVNPTLNDLNEIVRESLVLYREAHREVAFSFSPDPALPPCKLDREGMKRVMMNLLDNAVAAVNGSGTVEVETRYNPSLQMITLEVRDGGCGVPDEDKPKLFEPYFSTKGSGTGLGLAIVSSIVADHNGFVRVRDNHPRGTRFIIELPVRR